MSWCVLPTSLARDVSACSHYAQKLDWHYVPSASAIPVRDVRRLLHERIDDTTEGEKRLIDGSSFASALVLCSRLANVFRASEINQVELANLNFFYFFFSQG